MKRNQSKWTHISINYEKVWKYVVLLQKTEKV